MKLISLQQNALIQVVEYHAQQASINLDKGTDQLEKARDHKMNFLKVNRRLMANIFRVLYYRYVFLFTAQILHTNLGDRRAHHRRSASLIYMNLNVTTIPFPMPKKNNIYILRKTQHKLPFYIKYLMNISTRAISIAK